MEIFVKVALFAHQYNLLPYNYVTTHAASELCKLFNGKICDLVMHHLMDEDPSVDYHPRFDVYMSNLPSGSSYKNFVHYG